MVLPLRCQAETCEILGEVFWSRGPPNVRISNTVKLTHAILPAALAGALLMTACSGGGDQGDQAESASADCIAPGAASDGVKFDGEIGTDLELTSPSPVKVATTERTVLEEGEGDPVEEGQSISVSMTMFNGEDGSALQQMPASSVKFGKEALQEWAYNGISCATAGSQAVVAAPYGEVWGEVTPDELGMEGVTEETPFVMVWQFGEITDAPKLLDKAEGDAQEAPADFPTVKLAENGEPTITMPEGVEPPTELSIATLIKGEGEEVLPGDTVHVNYRGVIWSTGEEFDSSWSRGEPTSFQTTGVIGGFKEALEGQTVGSQVISVVPAEDGGYGAEWLEGRGYKPDDVMVFVLDILGTEHAA